ncbi:MAG: NAD-dependent epimerase/dehydratase family protein [Chitinophagales bacterium]
MRKVVVSGAGGHIGFNVAKKLLANNYEVLLLVRSINVNIIELKNLGASIHSCNLLEERTYLPQIENFDAFFHLAAENTTSMQNEARVLENTLQLTKSVAEACVKAGIQTLIYTSSVVVLGRSKDTNRLINENDVVERPESPYVKGKLEAEKFLIQFAKDKNIDIRHIYPSWVVGPGDAKLTPPHKVIKDFVSKGQAFYFDGGISIADVEAVADAQISALENGTPNGKYIIGGENITFNAFYEILSGFSGKKQPKLKLPKWFIYFGALVLDILLKIFGKRSPVSPEYVESVVGNYSWYDSNKAIKELDYQPEAAKEILRKAIQETYKRMAGTINLGKRTNLLPEITTPSQEKTLMITGVPGWLGNRMVDILINGDRFGNYRTNRKIKILTEPRFKGLLNLPENFEIVYADLTNRTEVMNVVKEVDTIFHLAGAIYPKQVDVLYKVNERGTRNIVDACVQNGIKRIVYMSTDSTCGYGSDAQPIFDENTASNPYKHYGKSKLLAENYILEKSKNGAINGTSLRGFWFFGPFAPERNMTFVNMFYWPRQIVFGNGKNLRSISHVDDIIAAFLQAENNENTYNNWYWIGNDLPYPTVDTIYSTIAQSLGVPYKPVYVPKILCRVLEKTDIVLNKFNYIQSTIQAAGKFDYNIAGSIDKAKRDFGYSPRITLKDAADELKSMVDK